MSYVCINCGAALEFAALEKATCTYCGAVNDKAQADLLAKAAAARKEQLTTESRRRVTKQVIGVSVAAVVVLLLLGVFRTAKSLSALDAEVQRARSQGVNVRERQTAVVARWAGQEPSSDREAELAGAENRVAIERARYDQAAAAYNAAVDSAWAGLCARARGLPSKAELSGAVTW